ncbi:hypothetical protein CEXT_401131 [Caerostris extrusa]|uniref:Uncharacterized protein n=1 Tax=Caerostris extrusa TaxID=172846 RepID=A0AAV4Q244_CAEEX|nr:hypothetical protein CEXT_401131 [Caerostris extrusa]
MFPLSTTHSWDVWTFKSFGFAYNSSSEVEGLAESESAHKNVWMSSKIGTISGAGGNQKHPGLQSETALIKVA